MVPGEGAHRYLHDRWNEARGHRFFVRQRYAMPPTDPRWLDMDDDEVLDEAVRLAYYELHVARADPSVRAQTEPDSVEKMRAEHEEIVSDTAFMAKIAAVARAVQAEAATPPQPAPARASRGRFNIGTGR